MQELTSIMCDNQRCKALATNPKRHSRTKHIDVQHHFIREKLEKQEICLKYYPMKDIIADVLTKPLANNRHLALTKTMSLETFDYSQSGSVVELFNIILCILNCVRPTQVIIQHKIQSVIVIKSMYLVSQDWPFTT